jgi:hypothetical protein
LQITANTRDETGPKGQSASSECQRQKRASKNRKTSSKGEKKAKNSEKKARKREEEILRAQKATEGETQGQSKQEIQNSSPIENTQASQVTDCHPAQQTNASTESLKTGPVPLSSNPEQWCSCKGRVISQTWRSIVGSIFYNKLPWFVSEQPEKDTSNVVVQCSLRSS